MNGNNTLQVCVCVCVVCVCLCVCYMRVLYARGNQQQTITLYLLRVSFVRTFLNCMPTPVTYAQKRIFRGRMGTRCFCSDQGEQYERCGHHLKWN